MTEQIKKSILRLKLNDFIFDCDNQKTKQYLADLLIDAPLDKNLICIEGLAYGLNRHIIVLSSLSKHSFNPIIQFNSNINKPPFVVGAYDHENKTIFRPFFVDRQTCYDLSQHKNRFEIITYHSRSLPTSRQGRSVLDQELYSLLSSLEACKKFIGSSPCTLLTDSRALYMLFSKAVHSSSTRIFRWNLKLRSDWPNLNLCYIKFRKL